MLVIRFLRIGRKNQPFFRIVVTDKKNPPQGGRFLEILGFFNPLTKERKLKAERIKYWLSVGAKPSDTVHNLLVSEGIIKAQKIPVHKKPKKKEEKKAEAETLKTEPVKEEPKKEEKPPVSKAPEEAKEQPTLPEKSETPEEEKKKEKKQEK